MASAGLSLVPWHFKSTVAFFLSPAKQCCQSMLKETVAPRCSTWQDQQESDRSYVEKESLQAKLASLQ